MTGLPMEQLTNVDGEVRLCVNAYKTVPEFKRTSINAVEFCRHFFAPKLCKRSVNVVFVNFAKF